MSGFVTGMGAAAADTLYGAVAGFGLTAISTFLFSQAFWMKLAGGLFLVYLGLRSFLSRPADQAAATKSKSLAGHFVSTFFLTVTNPATILSFLAIFAGLGLDDTQAGIAPSALLVAGVFMGSALWWLILSYVVSLFSTRITPAGLTWINRASGMIIIAFGCWALYAAFTHHQALPS